MLSWYSSVPAWKAGLLMLYVTSCCFSALCFSHMLFSVTSYVFVLEPGSWKETFFILPQSNNLLIACAVLLQVMYFLSFYFLHSCDCNPLSFHNPTTRSSLVLFCSRPPLFTSTACAVLLQTSSVHINIVAGYSRIDQLAGVKDKITVSLAW